MDRGWWWCHLSHGLTVYRRLDTNTRTGSCAHLCQPTTLYQITVGGEDPREREREGVREGLDSKYLIAFELIGPVVRIWSVYPGYAELFPSASLCCIMMTVASHHSNTNKWGLWFCIPYCRVSHRQLTCTNAAISIPGNRSLGFYIRLIQVNAEVIWAVQERDELFTSILISEYERMILLWW